MLVLYVIIMDCEGCAVTRCGVAVMIQNFVYKVVDTAAHEDLDE